MLYRFALWLLKVDTKIKKWRTGVGPIYETNIVRWIGRQAMADQQRRIIWGNRG